MLRRLGHDYTAREPAARAYTDLGLGYPMGDPAIEPERACTIRLRCPRTGGPPSGTTTWMARALVRAARSRTARTGRWPLRDARACRAPERAGAARRSCPGSPACRPRVPARNPARPGSALGLCLEPLRGGEARPQREGMFVGRQGNQQVCSFRRRPELARQLSGEPTQSWLLCASAAPRAATAWLRANSRSPARRARSTCSSADPGCGFTVSGSKLTAATAASELTASARAGATLARPQSCEPQHGRNAHREHATETRDRTACEGPRAGITTKH